MSVLIAIDLGNAAIKVTVMKKTGRSWLLDAQHSQPVVTSGALITEHDQLAALDRLLEEHPGWANPSTGCALVWPAERATLHRMTVPFTDPDQVSATLPFAVEGEVPFELDDMVLGYRTLSVNSQTEVLVALVPIERLRKSLDALRGRGLHPQSVQIDGDSTALWTGEQSELIAIIDVGHLNTIVSIVRDGSVVMSRAINAGGADFTHAIKRSLNVSWEEAEAMKHGERMRPGSDDPLSPEARAAVNLEINVLLAAIRTTLITSEDALEAEVIQVHLTGGGSLIYPLAGLLKKDLGLPVIGLMSGDGDAVPPEFSASYALAMHQTGQGRGEPIELRVGELSYKGGVDILKTGVLLVAASLLFFSLVASALFAYRFFQLTGELHEVEGQIVQLVQKTLPEVSNVTTTNAMPLMLEAVQNSQTRAKVLKGSDAPPMATVFLNLATILPPASDARIKVKTLKLTPAALNFTAETTNYDASSAIEAALTKSSTFHLAEKSNEKKVRDTVQFNISVPLGDSTEGDE